MIECKIQLGLIRLPVGGAFSLLFSGLIPLGAGFALDATVTTTEEVGYDFTVAANASPRLGVACEPQCELVKELNFGPPQTAFRPVIPASIAALDDTLKLALGAFAFVYADLSFGNPFIEALQFESLNVKAGVRQTVDLESMDSQITKPDYASNFGLSLVAKISLGNKIQDFLDALDISLIPTGFELTSPLAQSAHGGLSISGPQGPGSAKAGEPVTFSVTLMPPTYLGLDSIGDVQIYRQEQNTTTSTLTPAICPTLTPNQVGMATCTGAFTELDVGSHTYVAVYYPRLFGVELPIPLEIAANSQTGFTVETAVDPDPDPAPETRFEVEVCAEVYNHDDGETLSEDCPEYDEEQPASDSASISAGGASANVTATSGPSTISITSSASSGSSANASSADACGTIDAEFSTVASRTITINPNISSMSNSSRANFDVRVVACSYVGPQKGGCQGPEGSLRFQGASSGPPQIRYKDGVFKDYDGGSLTIPLDSGNLVSISVCSGNWAEPGDGSVNSESTTSLNLN